MKQEHPVKLFSEPPKANTNVNIADKTLTKIIDEMKQTSHIPEKIPEASKCIAIGCWDGTL